MSWKATAFVKEITESITLSEKMLMFVLADYHNTSYKSAWPSIPTLAREALMSERTVYRLLDSLEGRRIARVVIQGRPNSYQFIGLDTHDIKSVSRKLTPDNTPDMTPDKNSTAIRKEEPVLEPVNKQPPTPFLKTSKSQTKNPELPDPALACSHCGKAGAFSWTKEPLCSQCLGRVPRKQSA